MKAQVTRSRIIWRTTQLHSPGKGWWWLRWWFLVSWADRRRPRVHRLQVSSLLAKRRRKQATIETEGKSKGNTRFNVNASQHSTVAKTYVHTTHKYLHSLSHEVRCPLLFLRWSCLKWLTPYRLSRLSKFIRRFASQMESEKPLANSSSPTSHLLQITLTYNSLTKARHKHTFHILFAHHWHYMQERDKRVNPCPNGPSYFDTKSCSRCTLHHSHPPQAHLVLHPLQSLHPHPFSPLTCLYMAGCKCFFALVFPYTTRSA